MKSSKYLMVIAGLIILNSCASHQEKVITFYGHKYVWTIWEITEVKFTLDGWQTAYQTQDNFYTYQIQTGESQYRLVILNRFSSSKSQYFIEEIRGSINYFQKESPDFSLEKIYRLGLPVGILSALYDDDFVWCLPDDIKKFIYSIR